MNVRIIKTKNKGFDKFFRKVVQRGSDIDPKIEKSVLEIAGDIAKKPLSLISATKKLLISSSEKLATFLEIENSLLLECIKSGDFQQCLENCMRDER